jgi:hypothetical protein
MVLIRKKETVQHKYTIYTSKKQQTKTEKTKHPIKACSTKTPLLSYNQLSWGHNKNFWTTSFNLSYLYALTNVLPKH